MTKQDNPDFERKLLEVANRIWQRESGHYILTPGRKQRHRHKHVPAEKIYSWRIVDGGYRVLLDAGKRGTPILFVPFDAMD